MRKRNIKKEDLYLCAEEVTAVLRKYNCVIETDDYCARWIRDKDTNETTGIVNPDS